MKHGQGVLLDASLMQLPFESRTTPSLGWEVIWAGFVLLSAKGCSQNVACPVVITDGINNSKCLCTRNALFHREKTISQSSCSFLRDLTEIILQDLSNKSIDAKTISWGICFHGPFGPAPPRSLRATELETPL